MKVVLDAKQSQAVDRKRPTGLVDGSSTNSDELKITDGSSFKSNSKKRRVQYSHTPIDVAFLRRSTRKNNNLSTHLNEDDGEEGQNADD